MIAQGTDPDESRNLRWLGEHELGRTCGTRDGERVGGFLVILQPSTVRVV